MSLKSLFSTKHINEFAHELADSLAKRYPPVLDVTPEKRISANRLTKVLEETLARAVEFQREHRLGTFGKAKLGNEFKWRLRELGYSEKFIDVATEGLMVYVTRGPDKSVAEAGEKKS
jgi:hypothetical protein